MIGPVTDIALQAEELAQDVAEPEDVPMTYEAFGDVFLRRVLHTERVLRSIDRILGPTFELGPIGAGPGRKIARLIARGRFLPTYGEELPADDVAYRVFLPVSVDFDLDLRVDHHHFHAEVVVPLIVRLRLVEPLTIVWDITPPEDYRIDLCVSCAALPADGDDEGIVAAHLEGGRCAVLRHTGSDALLADAIRFLYGDWLTASGEEPRDAPLFLQRIVFFPDVPEHEAITDIFLPLLPRR